MEDSGLRCPRCDYNLTGAPGPRCPECGRAIDWDRAARGSGGADARFAIEFAERLNADCMVIEPPSQRPAAPPQIEALIEATWKKCVERADREKMLLFNGPLVGLQSWRRDGDKIVIETSESDYRAFLGTNFHNGDRIRECGAEWYADPIGTSVMVTTSDGRLVFGRRQTHLACHGGYLHAIGGCLTPQDRAPDGRFDAFAAIRRELREELGVVDDDIESLVCIGLLRDQATHQPEMVFDAVLTIPLRELRDRFDPDGPDQEHTDLESCDDDPESVVPFLQRAEPVVPVAVGAQLLHGYHDWGLDWYEGACYVLFGDLPPRAATSS